ncbi:MAG: ABC transporter ATP-binding protein [Chloroflexi bacterium]|nr:ABC transporter ATP-binding protein [Chloroflexota bacterium]
MALGDEHLSEQLPRNDLRRAGERPRAPEGAGGIHLSHVTKQFLSGQPPAVNDFTLSIEEGAFMVLVGESGAGKSTVLRLVAGLESPDAGDIFVGGQWVNEVPVGKRGVQVIFQSLALWPHLKVLDEEHLSNISFPLKMRRWSLQRIRERTLDVTRRVGLQETLFDRKPGELSGGEGQRVALARAMVTDSNVYVMDEPLNSLDPIARTKMRSEVRRLHDELGATTLFVTHDIREALALADQIAVMRNGSLVQVGTADTLRNYPADPYVTELLNA